jgi:DEAD/DEAH box helicase domain-containing protein
MASLSYIINKWRADISIGGNITSWMTIPAQPARYKRIPQEIHPEITKALKRSGIVSLYSHQIESWKLVKGGHNIVVVTGTASGKTICYNLPVLDNLLRNPKSRALYLFPTKALAHDQLALLQNLTNQDYSENSNFPGNQLINPATYDGDTPRGSRGKIRERARLILSNPDMLHVSILPHHTSWEEFFRGLKFVILDEIHIYRGVFGSHVANIVRRLRRISEFYGGSLKFILTSATIGNPTDLAEKLIGEPVKLVDSDGSASGEKHFLIYNPPLINPELGLRAPLLQETVRLAEDILSRRIQTIIFGQSRRFVEILLTYLRSKVTINNQYPKDNQSQIRAYRSGYLPQQRREIEEGLRLGQVCAVIATTALELGIDIGSLEVSILAGYPGTISGTWQQAGRVGRGERMSLAILITSSRPLDQFISRNPEYIYEQHPEQVRINPNNLLILYDHLLCAAYELPFQFGDCYGELDPRQTSELLEMIQGTGALYKSKNKFFWMADRFPASEVSLRNVSKNRYSLQIMDFPAKIIGEVDGESAFWMVHPHSIYLHEGKTYIVQNLDIDNHIAHLQPIDIDYFTRARKESEVQILNVEKESYQTYGQIGYGNISLTTQVVGFTKIKWETHEKLGYQELELPSSDLLTTGYWFMFDKTAVEELRNMGVWSNDPNNYGPSWKTQREMARVRDDFLCQVCGIPESGAPHHVHHITPFRTFETDTEANALNNLTTLCPSCHKRVETSVRIRSGLAGLANILLNLTPLFLMCDIRDIGIHYDPKSPLNDSNPIIVIYDSIPGGLGFSQFLFEKHESLLSTAYDVVFNCECRDGCPSCVGPGGEFGFGGKLETLAILKLMTGNSELGIIENEFKIDD